MDMSKSQMMSQEDNRRDMSAATERSRKGAWPEGDWRPGMDTDGNELDWTKIDQAMDAEERRLGRHLTFREMAEIQAPILAKM